MARDALGAQRELQRGAPPIADGLRTPTQTATFACKNLPGGEGGAQYRHVRVSDILRYVIAPEDPTLARRINALLWAYERSRLRHSVFRDDLSRQHVAPTTFNRRSPAQHANGSRVTEAERKQ